MYLGDAISSVLSQSFEAFEIIIIDDGSTDYTAEIVKKIHDVRLIYIYQRNPSWE